MDDAPLKLKREVEPPQRSSNGLGVMIVASAAMFFAVAASAFILRSRMVQCRAAARATPVHVQVIAPAATPSPCGEARVIDNGDGTKTVTFDACAEVEVVTVDGDNRGVATRLPADIHLAVPLE